jgi:hypothetical protein
MKTLLLSLCAITLFSCNITTQSEDTEMIQKKYPAAVVYPIDQSQYIVCDTTHVYHLHLSLKGDVYSTIKIK